MGELYDGQLARTIDEMAQIIVNAEPSYAQWVQMQRYYGREIKVTETEFTLWRSTIKTQDAYDVHARIGTCAVCTTVTKISDSKELFCDEGKRLWAEVNRAWQAWMGRERKEQAHAMIKPTYKFRRGDPVTLIYPSHVITGGYVKTIGSKNIRVIFPDRAPSPGIGEHVCSLQEVTVIPGHYPNARELLRETNEAWRMELRKWDQERIDAMHEWELEHPAPKRPRPIDYLGERA